MTCKIAILTDVHGNSPALRAVFEDLKHQEGVRHIYCLGDMVAIGPDTNEVLDLLFSRDDVSMLLGNHEEDVMAIYEGRAAKDSGGERRHHEWIVAHTDPVYFPKLRNLPRVLEAEYEGKKLLFVHYHLDDEFRFRRIDREPTVEKLDAMYEGYSADIVCFGHHHPVHFYTSPKRIYFNPGSLGCCERPVARYALLHLDADGIQVERKEIPYDNTEFLASYHKLGVPEGEFLLKAFHGNQGQQE